MPENGSAQPHVDYYATFGLQPASPPDVLIAQLSHRIAPTPPGPERHLMEQARAILGDVGKKQVYDRRLTNPHAKPWTPDELHALALAHPSRPARSGLAAKLSAIPRRVLAAVAGGLALALVLVITLVSCTGGSGPTGTNTTAGDSHAGTSASADCRPVSVDDVAEAAWAKGAEPDHAIVLTDAYPLPSDMSAELARLTGSVGARAVQAYSGDRIVITLHNMLEDKLGGTPDGREGKHVKYSAMYTDGELTGQKVIRYNTNGSVKSTEEQGSVEITDNASPKGKHNWGTFRIAAVDGVTVPAKADSEKTGGKYALDVLSADSGVWLLLRGGTDLYKGRVVEATPGTNPADCV